jgi:hypothetical protein
MYAGTTLTPFKRFDAWFGAHQKIDRIARRNLKFLLDSQGGMGKGYILPTGRDIVTFEGLNGPDGIKRKTPAKDEPWHFYDPQNPADDRIITIIYSHYDNLVAALQDADRTRAAFEMAWLAHALVDGLTPAHHYPYEEELMKLRGGAGKETRTSIKDKVLMPGSTLPNQVKNNWKMWGDKGLLATHFAFEWGIAIMINPMRMQNTLPSSTAIAQASTMELSELFKRQAAAIAELDMYNHFYQYGWTIKLAKVARRQLVPQIIGLVTIAWYKAALDAGVLDGPAKGLGYAKPGNAGRGRATILRGRRLARKAAV